MIKIFLLKKKLKPFKNTIYGYFQAKKTIIGLIANKFAVKIGNFCNSFLSIYNIKEILDHSCFKKHPQ